MLRYVWYYLHDSHIGVFLGGVLVNDTLMTLMDRIDDDFICENLVKAHSVGIVVLDKCHTTIPKLRIVLCTHYSIWLKPMIHGLTPAEAGV